MNLLLLLQLGAVFSGSVNDVPWVATFQVAPTAVTMTAPNNCLYSISWSAPVSDVDISLGGVPVITNGSGTLGAASGGGTVNSACNLFFGGLTFLGGPGFLVNGLFDSGYPDWQTSPLANASFTSDDANCVLPGASSTSCLAGGSIDPPATAVHEPGSLALLGLGLLGLMLRGLNGRPGCWRPRLNRRSGS